MRLTQLYIRFYKSFNYDYERKFNRSSEPDPWEHIDGAWFPFVRIDLEQSITTVVGANESGKSHLLDAIEKVIRGRDIEMADFCRYSHFFSVIEGQRRRPDFGCEFEITNADDASLVKAHLSVDAEPGDRFRLFRLNGAEPVIYRRGETEPLSAKPKQEVIETLLPAVFRLDAEIPLPDSIPIHELEPGAHQSFGSRESRFKLDEAVLSKSWGGAEAIKQAADSIFSIFSAAVAPSSEVNDRAQQHDLARKLLFDVAGIDRSAFVDVSNAIIEGKDGYANAVIQKVNEALATHLNFPRWWAQDRDFRLLVSRSEFELVFTIRDRTGTDYSFGERSSGLKYFLSYHVQLLAHRPPKSGQVEILLMDEPDAYLSSQGQQDLLRILEEFALPEDGTRRDQVVYVTHSPFLINRNAADWIRVLDKGVTDEGTRVVTDVAKNHYEPLRSALGAFVAETSFIGGSNLFVEGMADQVLLAGTSSHLLSHGAGRLNTLDLNAVTIVPAGSASSIPYLVYLARGRDVVRPPCVALLDGDQAGADAAKALAKGGGHRKEILPKKFIIDIGDWATKSKKVVVEPEVTVIELEDLIALPVVIDAARNYAVKFLELKRHEAEALDEAAVRANLIGVKGSVFEALKVSFSEAFGAAAHIDKIGFAKEVVAALAAARTGDLVPTAFKQTEDNFSAILARLAGVLREAELEEQDRRLGKRLDRIVDGFLSDYPAPTTRERGRRLLDEVEASLERSEVGDQIRLKSDKMRRDFALDEDLTEPIENFGEFRDRVRALRYEERFVHQSPKVLVGQGAPEIPPAAGEANGDGVVGERPEGVAEAEPLEPLAQ